MHAVLHLRQDAHDTCSPRSIFLEFAVRYSLAYFSLYSCIYLYRRQHHALLQSVQANTAFIGFADTLPHGQESIRTICERSTTPRAGTLKRHDWLN